jgi:outer membrane protein
MNTKLKSLLLAAPLALWSCAPAFAQSRIATVDVQKVFDKYWKTDQAVAALRDRADEIKKSHDDMVDNWRKAKAEYQKLLEAANNQAVSSAERERRNKAAEEKLTDIKKAEDDINQFDRQANATLGEQRARMRKNILDEIKLAIGSKAKSGGFSLVIDSGAQTYVADPTGPYYSPMILYSNNENDITEAVISQLNAGAPIDQPASDQKKSSPKGGGN